jgi:hypothetical protein
LPWLYTQWTSFVALWPKVEPEAPMDWTCVFCPVPNADKTQVSVKVRY